MRSDNYIICVGRQLGSGGREVAKKISERLDIAYYDKEIITEIERQSTLGKKEQASASDDGGDDSDAMLPAAIEVVIETGQASTSMLQRKLKLGYARAARLMDEMEARGIIGGYEGAKPRAVLITREQWMEMKAGEE